jgi:hypothetical protein
MRRKDAIAGRCPEFDRESAAARRANPARQAAWEAHLRSCSSCQGQDVADRALRALLGAVAHPQLPPGFAERCASRALRARRSRS